MTETTKLEHGSFKGEKPRHVLSLSGGKDSAALAIYMRDRVPEMEYIFHDTDKELPERTKANCPCDYAAEHSR